MVDSNFHKLKYKSIHGKDDGPHLLILAGVHGDEYEPMAAAMQLLKIVPDIIEQGVVTIVPIVNIKLIDIN